MTFDVVGVLGQVSRCIEGSRVWSVGFLVRGGKGRFFPVVLPVWVGAGEAQAGTSRRKCGD
jgi:hypothetical protein